MVKNYSNRTRKKFIVIAYDVADTKRRERIVKLLERLGHRVNYSVFECLITSSQLSRLKSDIATIYDASSDRIIYYPLCVDCYSHIEYQPEVDKAQQTVVVS